MATVAQTKLLTAEEFMAADLGEGNFELVRGEVVEVPPAMPEHGRGLCEVAATLWRLRTQVGLRICIVQRLGRGHRARPRHGSRARRLLLQPRSLASVGGWQRLAPRSARPGGRGRFSRQPGGQDQHKDRGIPGGRSSRWYGSSIRRAAAWSFIARMTSLRSSSARTTSSKTSPSFPASAAPSPTSSSESARGPHQSPMSTHPADATARRPRWPWVVLGLGLVWTVLIRVPLVLNAEDHLDSDLAVDGLTLLDAVHGHWRWHYPGTPYMGILPMLSSYPQALVWGANPITLVSGGRSSGYWSWPRRSGWRGRAFGLEVAGWAIVPLVFSSLGTIWLSGRITGGHLLTLVWHTVAFVGLYACLTRAAGRGAAALGLWCGLGLYLDAMFLFTLAGLVPAAMLAWLSTGRSESRHRPGRRVPGRACWPVSLPREIGRRVDPYDAYPSQFAGDAANAAAIWEHARLLVLHCLPRLIAGTELHELRESAARPIAALATRLGWLEPERRIRSALPGPGEWLAVLLLRRLSWRLLVRLRRSGAVADPARKAVGRGTLSRHC